MHVYTPALSATGYAESPGRKELLPGLSPLAHPGFPPDIELGGLAAALPPREPNKKSSHSSLGDNKGFW